MPGLRPGDESDHLLIILIIFGQIDHFWSNRPFWSKVGHFGRFGHWSSGLTILVLTQPFGLQAQQAGPIGSGTRSVVETTADRMSKRLIALESDLKVWQDSQRSCSARFSGKGNRRRDHTGRLVPKGVQCPPLFPHFCKIYRFAIILSDFAKKKCGNSGGHWMISPREVSVSLKFKNKLMLMISAHSRRV